MSLTPKTIKAPDPVKPANMTSAQDQLDQDRRNRARAGGRGASFLFDAAPVTSGAPKSNLFGG